MSDSLQQNEPLLKKEHMPKEKLMKKLIKDEFRFERRKYIFLTVNTSTLILTIYNLLSPINIESQKSLIFYEESRNIHSSSSLSLLNLIDSLVLVHLIRFFTCILGYFSTSQKSERIITYFMMMSTICVLGRGIVSLLILLNYEAVISTCNLIFNGTDSFNIGETMAYQFLTILLIFMVIEIFLALISLVQCSKSKEEYAVATKEKERVLKSYNLCYEVAIYQIDD